MRSRDGVDHIVEIAFDANIKTDTDVLAQGGSIATYATNTPMPETPVWQLVFVNANATMLSMISVSVEAPITARHGCEPGPGSQTVAG